MTSGPREVRAPRGPELTAKSWQTEAPLRMLMNNLDPENAERPDDLVVYGGTGKAARSWEAYGAIVRALTTLENDETLLVQSGKPVGVMRTHEWAPRVLIANSNLVGDWANWEEFRRLEHLGLTMYGQMTAGSWIYIGTQGILQGTFETFAAVADKRFGGTLAGTITLTAGLGGMGGAQPLAVTMNDGVAICIECDDARIQRRIDHRYLDVRADSLEQAVAMAIEARDARKPLSIGVLGNAAELVPALLEQGAPIDVVTDQTSAHDPLYYLPVGTAFEDWDSEREADPVGFTKRARDSMAAHVRAMVEFQDNGAEVFDYGNSIRDEARKGGYDRAFDFPGLRAGVHPSAVLRGQGPVPLGGALRRPGRHRGHRQGDPRAVPRQRAAAQVDHHGRREGVLPGAAGQDLLARVRRAPPGRAQVQRDGRERGAQGSDRDRPRPPGQRQRGLALPGDRVDARRVRRDRRLAAAQRPGQHRVRARPGCRSITAAASAWAARSTPARSPSPTAPSSPRRRSSGC